MAIVVLAFVVIRRIIALALAVVRRIVVFAFVVVWRIVALPFVVVRMVLNTLWTLLLYCLGFRQRGVLRGMPHVPIRGSFNGC